jgi:hypothetical protein
MKSYEFYQALAEYMKANPNYRRGQAAFNLMHDIYPITADLHRGGRLDPYYNSDLTDAFIEACLPNARDHRADDQGESNDH